MWPWDLTLAMSLTLNLNMKFAILQPKIGPIATKWKMQSLGLTLVMTFTLDFQGQILKQPYLRNRRANWHGKKASFITMTMTFGDQGEE